MRLSRLAALALAGAIAALWIGIGAAAVQAQEPGALARLDGAPALTAGWRRLAVTVPITQPVPWRTRLMADPPRAVVDFRTLDWGGFDPASVPLAGQAASLRVGDAGGGWSRLVIELTRPMGFARAGLSTDPETGRAVLAIELAPVSDADFAAQAAALAGAEGDGPVPAAPGPARLPLGVRPTVVVLDPGHGGVDHGASHGGVNEADIMLTFARELAEALRREGRYEVVMTRDGDVFVSLEERITVAHAAAADLFLSLHADALEGPQAQGATIYTLAAEASDAASAALAERHDRDDLLGSGVDLSGTDDLVATVLMDLARTETGPATERLARSLVTAIRDGDLRMHRHPWQQAAFSVLKSPTVPSALIELGFLSSEQDRARLQDRRWRARMVRAIVLGLDAWVADEAARQALQRR